MGFKIKKGRTTLTWKVPGMKPSLEEQTDKTVSYMHKKIKQGK